MRRRIFQLTALMLCAVLAVAPVFPSGHPSPAAVVRPCFTEAALNPETLLSFLHHQILRRTPRYPLLRRLVYSRPLNRVFLSPAGRRIDTSFQEFLNGDSSSAPSMFSLFATGLRSAGVLMPAFSMRSLESEGAGDAYDIARFAQIAARWGLGLLQFLPLRPISPVYHYPYSPISDHGYAEYLIRVRELPETSRSPRSRELLEQREGARARLNDTERVDFKEVWQYKTRIFLENYRYLRDHREADPEMGKRWQQLQDFREQNPWLRAYGSFIAAKETLGWDVPWLQWPDEYRNSPQRIAVIRDHPERREIAEAFEYAQWCVDAQMSAVQRFSNWLGVVLKDDLAAFITKDSVETWAHPERYDLDVTVGHPPEEGREQDWFGVAFNVEELRRTEAAPIFERVAAAVKLGALRLDAVRTWFQFWPLPKEATNVKAEARRRAAAGEVASPHPELLQGLSPAGPMLRRIHARYAPLRDVLRVEAAVSRKEFPDLGTPDFGDAMEKTWARVMPDGATWSLSPWERLTPVERLQRFNRLIEVWQSPDRATLRDTLVEVAIRLDPQAAAEYALLQEWGTQRQSSYVNGIPLWRWMLAMGHEEQDNLLRHVETGDWANVDGEDLIRRVMRTFRDQHGALLLAEDLGSSAPAALRRLLQSYGLWELWMTSLNWAQEELDFRAKTDDYPPEIAGILTNHDSGPLKRMWETPEKEGGFAFAVKERLLTYYLGPEGHRPEHFVEFTEDLHRAYLAKHFASPSFLVIQALQDILRIDGLINVPGVQDPDKLFNWVGPRLETLSSRGAGNPFHHALGVVEELLWTSRRHSHLGLPWAWTPRVLRVFTPADLAEGYVYAMIHPAGRSEKRLVVEYGDAPMEFVGVHPRGPWIYRAKRQPSAASGEEPPVRLRRNPLQSRLGLAA